MNSDNRSPADVLRIMRDVYDWLYRHTESFEPRSEDDKYDTFGAEISYLLSAIMRNHRVELGKESPLLYVLTDEEFTFGGTEPPPEEVWNYIERT